MYLVIDRIVHHHASIVNALGALAEARAAIEDDPTPASRHWDADLAIAIRTLSGLMHIAEERDPELKHLRPDPFADVR